MKKSLILLTYTNAIVAVAAGTLVSVQLGDVTSSLLANGSNNKAIHSANVERESVGPVPSNAAIRNQELSDEGHSLNTSLVTDEQGEISSVDDVDTSEIDVSPGIRDFRNAAWGMTREQVQSIETGKLLKASSDSLAYEGTVEAYNVKVYYLFGYSEDWFDDEAEKNRLVRGAYFFETPLSGNWFEYIEDYRRLKGLVSEKYGTPAKDEENWKDEAHPFRELEGMKGELMLLGEVSFAATWITPRTAIELTLYSTGKQENGEETSIHLYLSYWSRDYVIDFNSRNAEDILRSL